VALFHLDEFETALEAFQKAGGCLGRLEGALL
jgi:hypothetical protein